MTDNNNESTTEQVDSTKDMVVVTTSSFVLDEATLATIEPDNITDLVAFVKQLEAAMRATRARRDDDVSAEEKATFHQWIQLRRTASNARDDAILRRDYPTRVALPWYGIIPDDPIFKTPYPEE